MGCEERKDTSSGNLHWEIKRYILYSMISMPIVLTILTLAYFEKIGQFSAALITVIIVAIIFFAVGPKIIELGISFVVLFYIGAMFLATTVVLFIVEEPSFLGLFFTSVATIGFFALAVLSIHRKSTT